MRLDEHDFVGQAWLDEQLREVVKERDEALEVLRGLEWVPKINASGVLWKCPVCHAWRPDPHTDDCALAAALTTGRRQQPEVPSESGSGVGPRVGIPRQTPTWPSWSEKREEAEQTLTLDGREVTPEVLSEELLKWKAEQGECQPEAVVSWSSYDELLTSYLKLGRERVLVNVLCVVSSLIAFIVLAVQVYNVLRRGY